MHQSQSACYMYRHQRACILLTRWIRQFTAYINSWDKVTGKKWQDLLVLTGNLQRSVVTNSTKSSLRVGSVTMVHPDIRFAVLVMDNSQKEQLTARQQHPMRTGILIGRNYRLSVAVPRNHGGRAPFCFTVECGRFVPCHILILGMFGDPRICAAANPRISRRLITCT